VPHRSLFIIYESLYTFTLQLAITISEWIPPLTKCHSLPPSPINQAGQMLTKDDPNINEEDFYSKIDTQLAKVKAFTLQCVTEFRWDILLIEREVAACPCCQTRKSNAFANLLQSQSKQMKLSDASFQLCTRHPCNAMTHLHQSLAYWP